MKALDEMISKFPSNFTTLWFWEIPSTSFIPRQEEPLSWDPYFREEPLSWDPYFRESLGWGCTWTWLQHPGHHNSLLRWPWASFQRGCCLRRVWTELDRAVWSIHTHGRMWGWWEGAQATDWLFLLPDSGTRLWGVQNLAFQVNIILIC